MMEMVDPSISPVPQIPGTTPWGSLAYFAVVTLIMLAAEYARRVMPPPRDRKEDRERACDRPQCPLDDDHSEHEDHHHHHKDDD